MQICTSFRSGRQSRLTIAIYNRHRVYANTYEVYWKRKTEGQQNIISDNIGFSIVGTYLYPADHLQVTSDFRPSFQHRYHLRSASIVFQRALKVENTGTVYAGQGSYYESNYLRAKSLDKIPGCKCVQIIFSLLIAKHMNNVICAGWLKRV